MKERSGTTPLDTILADVTWHTRRSRFELYARFCRDWYWYVRSFRVAAIVCVRVRVLTLLGLARPPGWHRRPALVRSCRDTTAGSVLVPRTR